MFGRQPFRYSQTEIDDKFVSIISTSILWNQESEDRSLRAGIQMAEKYIGEEIISVTGSTSRRKGTTFLYLL